MDNSNVNFTLKNQTSENEEEDLRNKYLLPKSKAKIRIGIYKD